MTAAIAVVDSSDLSDLLASLTTTIELLGWASKTRKSGVTGWVIHNPSLLPGLRHAAMRSLASDGVIDPSSVCDAALSTYGGNEFLAYRSLLSESALTALASRFQQRFKGAE